jgi:hypothetical protein
MKRLILISASLMLTSAIYAQSGSLYNFDNTGSPKEVRKLGEAPEFPFLRNLSTPHEVYMAMMKHANDNTTAMRKLNNLLMQQGYANGVRDLQESDITMEYVKPGTEGNMGSRGYVYSYYRLEGNPSEFKAWKIADKNGNTNSSLYLFAKCGNAFAPKMASTACIDVPVQVKPDVTQINLPASGSEVTTTNQEFVYYARKHRRKHDATYALNGVSDKYPSKPLKVNSTKDQTVMPENYTVSLSSPQNTISACQDVTLNLTANINVDKSSTYTGNYPKNDNSTYKRVSKHTYKMAARKMRKSERKANRIAKKTGEHVDIKTNRA